MIEKIQARLAELEQAEKDAEEQLIRIRIVIGELKHLIDDTPPPKQEVV